MFKRQFLKGQKILQSLKESNFNDGFGNSLKTEDAVIQRKKNAELVQYTIEGELKEVLTRNKRKRKKSN